MPKTPVNSAKTLYVKCDHVLRCKTFLRFDLVLTRTEWSQQRHDDAVCATTRGKHRRRRRQRRMESQRFGKVAEGMARVCHRIRSALLQVARVPARAAGSRRAMDSYTNRGNTIFSAWTTCLGLFACLNHVRAAQPIWGALGIPSCAVESPRGQSASTQSDYGSGRIEMLLVRRVLRSRATPCTEY